MCMRPSYAVFPMIRSPSVKTDHKMQEAKRIFNHHAYSVRAALYQQRFKVVWFRKNKTPLRGIESFSNQLCMVQLSQILKIRHLEI